MSTSIQQSARFDARLPKKQKEFFERAAQLGGYRSLTDFVIATLQARATDIVAKREAILASEKDREIFFSSVANPKKPNKALANALKDYNAFMSAAKAK